MSTALATYDLDREKIDLIKQTVAKGATDLELDLFLHACKRTGLDPLMKQIYAIKRWNAKAGKEEMAIQTGIDGYRLIADRTGQYAGSDEASYMLGDDGFPDVASVTVYKLVGGMRCAFSSSARWKEYCQLSKDGKPTSMWQKMPFLMIAKCAEALALRKAFPAELSGVYTHEEMMQADAPEPVGKTSDQKFTAISNQPVDTKQAFAEKFPEQAKAIQEKLKEPVVNPAAPASLLPGDGSWIVPFGKNKGQRIADVVDGDLDYLIKYYLGKLNDRANATSRFRDEWEGALVELRAEMMQRYPQGYRTQATA